MKFSETWLREWVNPPLKTEQLADQLTMAGLEVDSVTSAAPAFQQVVVGEIKTVDKHPEADRLSVCRVNVGRRQIVDIVCGGTNVRPGLKVAVVLVGGEIKDGTKIKKASLRGVTSHGMICSGRELGLTEEDEHHRILELSNDAPIGMDFRRYLALDDSIIDVDLTPNRGDCLSIRGIAREVGALNRCRVKSPKYSQPSIKIKEKLPIAIAAKKACPRYVGRIIRDIDNQAVTPIWMRERLRRSGLRSSHPVVDVMNYVMLELGQPLHAFDLEKLSGGIHVRYAKAGETLEAIDGQSITLQDRDLIIADKKKPQAIAGIMGGAESAVEADTCHLFLESAFFAPDGIALSARRLGMQTESSYRFERGVDFELQKVAIARATELVVSLCGGKPGPVLEKRIATSMPKAKTLSLRREQIERLLGIRIPDAEVKRLLKSLGMGVKLAPSGWKVKIPSYRFDLTQEADLIEELVRLRGYDRIPTVAMKGAYEIPPRSESHLPTSRIRQLLVDRDYYEAITYSFVDEKFQRMLNPDRGAIPLTNPISADMGVMRTSLWPGLLKAVQYNQHRQVPRVRLFEIGLCFTTSGGEWQQVPRLGGVVAGEAYGLQWSEKPRPIDFYDIKGDLMALLAMTHQPDVYRFVAEKHPALHPGQSAAIYHHDRRVGYVGALHPDLSHQLDVGGKLYLFELELESVDFIRLPKYHTISRFPSVRRDIAIVIDRDLAVEAIKKEIANSAGQLLNMVKIFDIYVGEGIETGKKSVALGLTFQHPSRTLIDEEINQVIERVVNILENRFNAKLRA